MEARPVEPIAWPNTAQYKRALLRPDIAFHDIELQRIQLDRDAMGTPASVEGQSAVVFFGRIDGEQLTIRCLKRPVAYGERRYASLRDVLAQWPGSPFASVDWRSNGVLVEGRRWPIVRMDHVPGTSMRQYVSRSLPAESDRLEALSLRWRELIGQLREHRIEHSDLQQDNVRVLDDGTLRLIDLDAVWAPPLSAMPPKEVGHRHFQHPERLRTGYWDAGVDTFSALVIYLSLRAIAADPTLWDDYHNDENLVLTDVDFENPGLTPIWSRLAASRDLEVRDLVALLARFCRQTVRIDVPLEAILRERTLPGGTVYVVSGEPLTRTWWPSGDAETGSATPGSGSAGSVPGQPGSGPAASGGPGVTGPATVDAAAAGAMPWGAAPRAGGQQRVPGQPTGPVATASSSGRPGVVDQWPYKDQHPGPAKPVQAGQKPVKAGRKAKQRWQPGPAGQPGKPGQSGHTGQAGQPTANRWRRPLIVLLIVLAVIVVIAIASANGG